jgi:hypothetical protein
VAFQPQVRLHWILERRNARRRASLSMAAGGSVASVDPLGFNKTARCRPTCYDDFVTCRLPPLLARAVQHNRGSTVLMAKYLNNLGRAFDELEMEDANAKAIAIARLWALTRCRRDEIAGLKWSEVNFERGLLVLSESKTGKSIRPLGLAAIALLRQIKRSDYVFPAVASALVRSYRSTPRLARNYFMSDTASVYEPLRRRE